MRKFMIVLCVVVAVVALLYAAVRIWLPMDKVRELVLQQISRSVGTAVTVNEIRPSFFPLGARVLGLEVENPAGPDSPPLVRLREGQIALRLRPLLARRIEIGRVALEGLEITVFKAAPGTTPPAAAKARAVPFAVLLSSAEIRDGSLHVIDAASGKEYSVGDFAAKASLKMEQGGARAMVQGTAALRKIRTPELDVMGYGEGFPAVSVTYDVESRPQEGRAEVRSVRVETGALAVALAGSVTGLPASPEADLSVSAPDIKLADVLALLPPATLAKAGELRGSGSLSLEGKVHTLPATLPAVRLHLTLGGLGVEKKDVPVKLENVRGTVEITERNLQLQGISGLLAGKPLALQGSVAFAPDTVVVEELRGSAGKSDFTLSARAEGPLGKQKISFQAHSRKIDLDEFLPPPAAGTAAAAGGKMTLPVLPVLPPLPNVTASGSVRVDTLVTAGQLLTGTEAKLELSGGTARGDLRLRSGLFGGGGVRVRNAGCQVSLARSAITADLAADTVRAYGVPLTAATGKVTVTPDGTVAVENMAARVYRGNVKGSARVAMKGPASADYGFDFQATDLEANDFLSNLTPAKNVLFGRLNLRSSWKGSGLTRQEFLRSVSASGEATVTEGRLKNLAALDELAGTLGLPEMKDLNFRNLVGNFGVADGRLRTEGLRLDSGMAGCTGAGSVGFDGSLDYDLTVTLSDALTEKARKKTSLTDLFANDQGQAVFDFKLAGTARHPKLTYDPSKTAARSGTRALSSVLKKIEEGAKPEELLKDLLKKKR